ncbi:helicase [candidate division WWE3 bacterium]|uniref:Helicase n=1 Tax=candidate division WWE3 bacterium TaxID=2053526 RepID=A0A7X9E801_UNCKA|nr:helicase [candidate division WWE3 bacterium]
MSTDTSFITNENNSSLLDRFRTLIKDTAYFDVLVGYFYSSGFHELYESLETTNKIRILIGIGTSSEVTTFIEKSKQLELEYSYSETKTHFENMIFSELENSKDSEAVEKGVYKFIEWLRSGKLEIKAYPTENLHAKLYIMGFKEGDRDVGRVITGSSNFTKSGLVDNLEFNVELSRPEDVSFAQKQFNHLWESAVDVSEKYIETVQQRTWLNDTITPYELYLKFLYEYFKTDLSQSEELFYKYIPENFKSLEYQEQAVLNAKRIVEEYGGVFISDVVGLGKTYIASMLAQQLEGRNLVLAPPNLLDERNLGSWRNVFKDFNIPATFESIGSLHKLVAKGTEEYKNVFIDESHNFRNEVTGRYELLKQICWGKRVILITATPLNNSPKDILSQIKLFQKSKKSTLPGLPNLESFFAKLDNNLKGLNRQDDHEEYMSVVEQNSRDIREKVLKHLMVRRTRSEIQKYFGEDLKRQNLKFPEVANPEPIFYQLDTEEDEIFNKTIELITKEFTYSRYMPMLYFTGEQKNIEEQGQRNMGRFMKILLIKRLESSFFAFKQTLKRFLYSYEQFINEYEKGNVYVSKGYVDKIFEMLENDDDEAVQRLIDEDKAQKYSTDDFDPQLKENLLNDMRILTDIQKLWNKINRDPKLLEFVSNLKSNNILKENKLIIFTESKETAEYIQKNLESNFPTQTLLFTGASSNIIRNQVIDNFDARARNRSDDFRILVTTEVLAEGVNLHRSNVVINYDLPWNPTRLMQRVGRINRVDTKFDVIYTFNFFPTQQANNQIQLKEAAEYKIKMFIEMLGNDARLLTDGEEIKSHDLFQQLTMKETITGEGKDEESELKFLHVIKDIRDKEVDLFEKIKRLPRKARTARTQNEHKNSLLSYMRKGRLEKFYLSDSKTATELDFITTANLLTVEPETQREKMGKNYYELLEKSKEEFTFATTDEAEIAEKTSGRDNATQLLKYLNSNQIKHYQGFTEDQEQYLKDVIRLLEEGVLPRQTLKVLKQEIDEELKSSIDPLKVIAVCKRDIPNELFKESLAESSAQTSGPREVILSEYFTGKGQ